MQDLLLPAKEETMLQDMTDRVIEIGRCYGMDINVENTQVMRISKQPSPLQIMIDQNHLEKVQYFKYLGGMITNDTKHTH
jgi:hypothetical protein